MYDAVWAAAYALHNTSEQLRNGTVRNNTSITLNDFSDNQFQGEINQVILNSTRNLTFRGVSVSVHVYVSVSVLSVCVCEKGGGGRGRGRARVNSHNYMLVLSLYQTIVRVR